MKSRPRWRETSLEGGFCWRWTDSESSLRALAAEVSGGDTIRMVGLCSTCRRGLRPCRLKYMQASGTPRRTQFEHGCSLLHFLKSVTIHRYMQYRLLSAFAYGIERMLSYPRVDFVVARQRQGSRVESGSPKARYLRYRIPCHSDFFSRYKGPADFRSDPQEDERAGA